MVDFRWRSDRASSRRVGWGAPAAGDIEPPRWSMSSRGRTAQPLPRPPRRSDLAVHVGPQHRDAALGAASPASAAPGGRRGCRRRPRSPRAPGRASASSAGRPASSLPWWATLSTSTSPGSTGASSASASPVSSSAKPVPARERDQRERVRLLARGGPAREPRAAATGRRSRRLPERIADPAATARRASPAARRRRRSARVGAARTSRRADLGRPSTAAPPPA